MAFTANTAFQFKVTNASHNGLQNITGKYGSFSGSTFTAADCSAGEICVKSKLLPCEGYENLSSPIYNGNSWYMVQAADGTSGAMHGDHTGLYVCNTYDVNKVVSGDLKFNLGVNTLGLGINAGDRGDFSEIIIGEQAKFGAGNFASTPTVGQYCAIDDGFFGASSSTAPTAGVYVKVLRSEPFNEGASLFGTGYVVEFLRAAEVELPAVTASDNGKVLKVVSGAWAAANA